MTNLNFCLAFPQYIPKELVELISQFTYNRSVTEVQDRINKAAMSYELPVPLAWLRYYKNNTRRLDWEPVYDFSSDNVILVEAVAETANLFHWSLMKYSRVVSGTLMKRSSKRDVVNTLRNWHRCAASNNYLSELVNLTWLALTGSYTLTKSAYTYNSLRTIQNLTFVDPNTLSRYYRCHMNVLPMQLFQTPKQVSAPSVVNIEEQYMHLLP